MLASFLSIGTSGLFNIYTEDENRSPVGHTLVYNRIFFFRDAPLRSQESTEDFYIVLKTGASVTRDLFDEYLYGYIGEISAENIQLSGTKMLFLFGASYNYKETLYRIPVQDQLLLSFKINFIF